jgi:hypothetical protein
VAQVTECLLCKLKTLSSNLVPPKKQKQTKNLILALGRKAEAENWLRLELHCSGFNLGPTSY